MTHKSSAQYSQFLSRRSYATCIHPHCGAKRSNQLILQLLESDKRETLILVYLQDQASIYADLALQVMRQPTMKTVLGKREQLIGMPPQYISRSPHRNWLRSTTCVFCVEVKSNPVITKSHEYIGLPPAWLLAGPTRFLWSGSIASPYLKPTVFGHHVAIFSFLCFINVNSATTLINVCVYKLRKGT